jgi:putative Holliday junction resolvase
MRYLAIDHGQKRTGLAVSDASETLVSPYSVIETTCEAELLRRILDVMKTEEIEAVVVGLPVNMDGTEGTRVKQVKQFVEKLRQQTSKPKKKKKRLDAIAAATILQSFFGKE